MKKFYLKNPLMSVMAGSLALGLLFGMTTANAAPKTTEVCITCPLGGCWVTLGTNAWSNGTQCTVYAGTRCKLPVNPNGDTVGVHINGSNGNALYFSVAGQGQQAKRTASSDHPLSIGDTVQVSGTAFSVDYSVVKGQCQ